MRHFTSITQLEDLKEALKERLPEKLWDVNFRALDYAKQA